MLRTVFIINEQIQLNSYNMLFYFLVGCNNSYRNNSNGVTFHKQELIDYFI